MLDILKKRWFLIGLVLAGILGYFFQALAVHFPTWWSLSLLFSTMCFVGLTANLKALAESFLNWKATSLSLVMTYAAAPAAAYLVGWGLFGRDHELFAGCVLVGCTASTISSAVVYTRIAGGNNALSIVLSNMSNIISIFLTPAMVAAFLSAKVEVNVSKMVVTLVIGVLVPVIIAQTVSEILGKKLDPFRPVASKLSQVGILIIVFSTVCKTFYKARGQEGFFEQLPTVGLQLIIASLVIYIVLVRLSYWLARQAGLSVPDSVAVGYASSQKTLPATIVLAESFCTPMAALPMIIYHMVQLLYGGYDGDRLKRLVDEDRDRATADNSESKKNE